MSGLVATDSPRVRVVKVGGSLLDWPGLPGVLQAWLDINPAAMNVLVVGGGALADAIRRTDKVHSLGEEAAHWLCIDVLSVTAQLLATMLKLGEPLSSLGQLRCWEDDAPAEPELYRGITAQQERRPPISESVVFDSREFLCREEAHLHGPVLPHDWSVTSDSIAARLTQVLGADELVLLKSCEPPAGEWGELARLGYVDKHFPRAAAGLASVRFVNLRGAIQPAPIARRD